ncbi:MULTISPECIES: DUF2721 domain-containing protein [Methylobacterium]|uniref:DUF2721 domain-containing protein n=1 Tax=Methylobacterium thuringiense TaxID=1003091 RepID=A0ABQ4TR01_9HYPH|nr:MULTISPECIES: DUF2721 domain-containing protein [Methylobacterium]TXN23734.1 DUF2721 domain-containing protein [Methylobacterium sp. WL9]GJE57294.1 hypothetical protein EKPJFOCH_3808 [Methylobacterium thuringiense]
MSPTDLPTSLDTVAHVIQVALTPVFLLGGIATLLNVFGNRLARVADQAHDLSDRIGSAPRSERDRMLLRIESLRLRSLILDAAVILCTLGGVAVCGAVLTLFVGALRDATVADVLFALFGLGILCTLGALTLFGVEMLLASRSLRRRLDLRQAEAERKTES